MKVNPQIELKMSGSSHCRLCAEIKPRIDLLEIKNEPTNLEYKILHCFHLQISEDDLLPKCVCSTCCQKVQCTYEFAERIEKAQSRLRADYGQSPEDKLTVKQEERDHDNFTNFNSDNSSSLDNESLKKLSSRLAPAQDVLKIEEILASVEIKIKSEDEEPISTKGRKGKLKLRKKQKRSMVGEKISYWRCSECEDELSSATEFEQHYLNVHKMSAKYQCHFCAKILKKPDSFKRHVRVHTKVKKHCCEICGKCFHKKDHHDRHIEIHSDEKKYFCSHCGKNFKTKNCLNVHSRLHLEHIRQKFECGDCNKRFSSRQHLAAHQKKHTGDKDFTCEQCGKSFTQRGNLDQHKLLHVDGRAYLCKQCPKAFKTVYRLNKHKSIHTSIKPHSCEFCGKLFRGRNALKRHSQIHAENSPYECTHCEKRFKMRECLKVHLRQHTGERPYSCISCNHHFTNWSNYNKHMLGRHGIDIKSAATKFRQEEAKKLENELQLKRLGFDKLISPGDPATN